MTFANLGLAVESSSVVAATPALEKMAAASRTAEAAARSLTHAEASSVPATNAAAAAARMHAVALQAQTTASRMAAIQQRNLIFQLNDVVVSAASGMSLQMIALQQGSQIFQNGIGNAFRSLGGLATSLVTKFAPVLAVVAALGVGVAALTTEINRNADEQVAWTDVVVAGWQLVSEWFFKKFDPIISWFAGLWDAVSPHIAAWLENTIANVDLAIRDLGTMWGALPGIVGEAAIIATNNILSAVDDLFNKHKDQTVAWLLEMARLVGPFLNGPFLGAAGALSMMPRIETKPIDNPHTGAYDRAQQELAQNRVDVAGTDHFKLLGDRARQIAAAGGVDDEKTKKAAKGIRSITDEFEKLQGKVIGVRDVVTGVFGDMGSVIAESFRKGGNVAMNILDGILGKLGAVGEKLMNSGLNALLDMGLNALTGMLTNSGPGFSYGPNVFADPWGGMRANGGPVEAGKAYVVGEKRPELFVPRSNGTIVPQVPGGGGMTVNIAISGSKQDAAAIANALEPKMRQLIVQFQKNPDR